jgi:hypothetical protein
VEAAADMSFPLAYCGLHDTGNTWGGRQKATKTYATWEDRRCLLDGLQGVSGKVRLTVCSSDTLQGYCSTILPMLSIKHTPWFHPRIRLHSKEDCDCFKMVCYVVLIYGYMASQAKICCSWTGCLSTQCQSTALHMERRKARSS